MEFFIFFQFDLEHSVTKSSPEACDLHANCLLKLKLVSVSMTMNKSYIVVELNINLASTSVWQHQPWYGGTMRPIGIWGGTLMQSNLRHKKASKNFGCWKNRCEYMNHIKYDHKQKSNIK